MTGLKLCVNTQTPLIQFLPKGPKGVPRSSSPALDLSRLVEGVDYRFSPGGVTRMVFPLVREWTADGFLEEAHWVSLNPSGPEEVRAGAVTLHGVSLGPRRMAGYGNVKEALWSAVHGVQAGPGSSDGVFWTDDFSEYAYYNRLTSERIVHLDRKIDFDVFYIHDFQQLPVGLMLTTLKPKVFRWHIPFDVALLPREWWPTLETYFAGYDIVIVSSDRYLDALHAIGFRGKARKIYPYVDPAEFGRPARPEVLRVARSLGIARDDRVVLMVARMDPMKGQDRAIRAIARLAPRNPTLKLVLVGNGSFSGARAGVGLSKSTRWKEHLIGVARHEGVMDRVIFTGHVSQPTLDALYERCLFTVLPSVREGFGLVVAESWIHRKAPIVTRRAGISELVQDGRNGLLIDPDRPRELPAAMERLLEDPEGARQMGRRGAAAAEQCSLAVGRAAETRVIQELV